MTARPIPGDIMEWSVGRQAAAGRLMRPNMGCLGVQIPRQSSVLSPPPQTSLPRKQGGEEGGFPRGRGI